MKRLPSLNAIKVFLKVAEMGGVSKAASKLHVSQSAVSRFISLLEGELGVELFNRKDGFSLTGAGKTLYEHVSRSFEILEEGVLRIGKERTTLKVKTNPSFVLRWVLHQKDIPTDISIISRWKSISFADDDFDIGIRWGLGDWPQANALCLYNEMLLPVCTRDYLENMGPFRVQHDFSRAQLIHSDPTHHDWQAWSKKWSGGAFKVDRGMTFDTLDNALQAALASYGIAMADIVLAQHEIATGKLVAAVPEVHPSGVNYYLVYRQKFAGDSRLETFAEWIKSTLQVSQKGLPPIAVNTH